MATEDPSELEMTIGQLKTYLDERFNSIDERFNSIDERFNSIDKRFNSIDERFNSIDERLISVDGRYQSIDQRFNDMEQRFKALENRMADDGVQTRRHFDVIAESLRAEISLRFETDTTLDNHERRIQALEKRRRSP